MYLCLKNISKNRESVQNHINKAKQQRDNPKQQRYYDTMYGNNVV